MQTKGDGLFDVLSIINDNAYKLDLPGKYNISTTLNVFYLSPFDVGDSSRMNPVKEGRGGMMRSKGLSLHLRIFYTFEGGQAQGHELKGFKMFGPKHLQAKLWKNIHTWSTLYTFNHEFLGC